MQLNNSIFDDLFRKKFDQLRADKTWMDWDEMLSQLSESGLTDLDDADIELHNKIAGIPSVDKAIQKSNWDQFEQQLSEAEIQSDEKLDHLVKSSLDKLSPPLANNSWNDFYLIYRNYINLRRSIFMSRFLEVTYIALIFVLMGSLDYSILWEESQLDADQLKKETAFEDDVSVYKELAFVPNDPGTGDAIISELVNTNDNQLETALSADEIEEITLVSETSDNEILLEQPLRTSKAIAELKNDISLEADSKGNISLTEQSNSVAEQLVYSLVQKKQRLILVSAFYGTSAPFQNGLGYGLSNLNLDYTSRSTFAGFNFGFQKGILELTTGVNYRRNVSMGRSFYDRYSFVEDISILELPASVKLFFSSNNTNSRPFLRFGGSGSFVVQVDNGDEGSSNGAELAKEENTIRGASSSVDTYLSDFNQLYFSLDLGLGYEYQFNSGLSLFMDLDYRHYLNSYKAATVNPSYYMLNSISGRLGGRFIIGSK